MFNLTFLSPALQGRPDHKYDICYQALMTSPIPLRGSTERKLHGEIASKLEAIGTPKQLYDRNGDPRPTRPDELQFFECLENKSVDLSAPEFDLLQRHVNATVEAEVFPKAWSRQGQETIEWLANVKTAQPAA